ncbi:MAG: DJ-1/PfpI family protein [Chloroflexi bacterium]|nr:DJ-1/PfpI family protein [Chloroflexota bacterium]
MSLPYRNKKKKRAPAYILIGDGFDELEVIHFLHQFRQAGLPIKSVSLFDGLVFSRQGVALKADFSLADKPIDFEQDCWLILPSGGRNGDVLRHDARIKTMLKTLNAGNGMVIVTDSGSDLADDVTQVVTQRPSLLRNTNQNLEEFIQGLTHRIVVA